jgi:hypothetical protein
MQDLSNTTVERMACELRLRLSSALRACGCRLPTPMVALVLLPSLDGTGCLRLFVQVGCLSCATDQGSRVHSPALSASGVAVARGLPGR